MIPGNNGLVLSYSTPRDPLEVARVVLFNGRGTGRMSPSDGPLDRPTVVSGGIFLLFVSNLRGAGELGAELAPLVQMRGALAG